SYYFSLMLPRPPRSPLFPYTTLFRSDLQRMEGVVVNQFEGGALNRVIEAPVAQYVGGAWEFHDGTMYVFSGETTVVTQFSRLRRSEEHTSELQSRFDLVCRLLLEKKT